MIPWGTWGTGGTVSPSAVAVWFATVEPEDPLEDFFEPFFFLERRGMELGFTVDDPGGVIVVDPVAVADPVADAGGVADGAVIFTCGMVFAGGVAFACGALFAAGVFCAGAAAFAGGIAADSEDTRVLRVPVRGTVSRAGKGVSGRTFSTFSEIVRPSSCCKRLRVTRVRMSICLKWRS